jgi:hypothetical protein
VFGARPLAQGAAAQRARCQAAGSTAGERGGWGHAQTWSPEIVSLKSMSSTIHFWNSFTFAMLFHTTRSTVWKNKVQINFFSVFAQENERRSNKSSRLPDGPGSQKEAGFLDRHELESAQRRAAPQPVPCVSAEAFCALP